MIKPTEMEELGLIILVVIGVAAGSFWFQWLGVLAALVLFLVSAAGLTFGLWGTGSYLWRAWKARTLPGEQSMRQ